MRLVLVRHGESTANRDRIHSGQADVPLTDKGIADAVRCGQLLSDIRFKRAFTSELCRAKDTCELILSENRYHSSTQVIESQSLNERCDGILTGLPIEKAQKVYGPKLQEWHYDAYSKPPQGESYVDVYDRVENYFRNVIQPTCQKSNVLVVAHNGSLSCLMAVIDGLKKHEAHSQGLKNASPVIYEL